MTLVLSPLVGQRTCQVESRNAEPLDKDLAEAIARAALLFERDIELLLRDQALLDKERADQQSRDSGTFHGASIGNPSFEL